MCRVNGKRNSGVSEQDLLEGVIGGVQVDVGQAGCGEVKPVPRNSQEKSQKLESVRTYLERTEYTAWSHNRN